MRHAAAACACCIPQGLSRRGLFGLSASIAAAMVLRPAFAAEGTVYDSMVLSCIDPRLVEPVHDWTIAQGLRGKYSQFVFAGAAVGVVSPKFAAWHQAFWDNLATSIQLHSIHRVIAIDHRDCGAAKIAYGADELSTPARETELHQKVAAGFRAEVAKRHPALQVEAGLMALDGSIVMFT